MGRGDSLQFSFLFPQIIAALASVLWRLKVSQGGCVRTRRATVSEVFPGYEAPMGIPVGSRLQTEDLLLHFSFHSPAQSS